MENKKIFFLIGPQNSGKTDFLMYLVKLKNKFSKSRKSLVCVKSLDEKTRWKNSNIKQPYLLTGLGKHNLDDYVRKIFVDDIDKLTNLQIANLVKDISNNYIKEIYITSSAEIPTNIYDKLSSIKYESIYICKDNFKLSFFQKVLNFFL